MSTNLNRILSSLCYFSMFFAPFLFPVVIYLAVQDQEVMRHAKRSFLSHLFPVIAIPLSIIIVAETEFSITSIVVCAILFGLSSLVIMAWNIVQGIKTLKA
ncbi:hypothetical protein QUF84_22580 [Fictibacillus enclensis]|uniref:hypothetical protein n=1 Tax=Fictibacillus enclensis TaxID=1017270 RepID=UPI0024BFA6F6|nr:hypothetical protein [Fictibacillus enclensis]MDM5339988.1 hypothetical protein [Fictibacillus enclensis]WHY71516.1 hypothetical protein QNH15_21310 [Fictibacillus enclensis]